MKHLLYLSTQFSFLCETQLASLEINQEIRKSLALTRMVNKIIRRRKRKSYEQLQMLIQEFQANPEWNKENMLEVSRKTGLSEAQVYKWGWDQKRKMLDPNHDIQEELRMYKKEQESEDQEEITSSIHKLKLPVSSKKTRKMSNEFKAPIDKSDKNMMKTRRSQLSTSKQDTNDNKENEYAKNMSDKLETRGVKRKLKFYNAKLREEN